MAGPQQKSPWAVAAALGAKSNYPNPKYTLWTTHYKPRTPDARDLDAGRYPILERHWPGFPLPWATTASPDTYERQVQAWRQSVEALVVEYLEDGS